mgnify:FL=1
MIKYQNQLPLYLHYCLNRKELDPKTIKAYRIDLTQFFQYLSERGMEMDKDGINQYLFYVHERYKQRTVKRKIASLKAFIGYLEYEEIIEENPFRKINTKFKEEIILPRTIPRDIVEHLLRKMYEEKEKDMTANEKRFLIRDIAVVEFLFATGLRVSELSALRREDMDLHTGIFLIKGKGSKERYMQIENREVQKAMEEYYSLFQDKIGQQEYFFLNKWGNRLSEQAVRIMLRKHVEKAGIPAHLTPHMFRHAFATLLLEEDVDIRYIQKMLGHSSIVTTQIYTYVAVEKQKEILRLKHPRNKMRIC